MWCGLFPTDRLDEADCRRLTQRAVWFAREVAGCTPPTADGLALFLGHPLTRRLLQLPESRLGAYLVNDAYKPRMHQMYAALMGGVELDFELSVRRSPISLAEIRDTDPELWRGFQQECRRRLAVPPYPPAVLRALRLHFGGFTPSQVMLRRAAEHGVAPVAWADLERGRLLAFCHGPAEASSHVETTLTQLVQELVVAAQVRRLRGAGAAGPDGVELLASALGRLAAGVERLNDEVAGGPGMMLFAGRRASSRRYLVLQNWYCRRHLRGYMGTSAVLSAAVLDGLVFTEGASEARAVEEVGPLLGTLAHELMMALGQLLACYDDLRSPDWAAQPAGGPAQPAAAAAGPPAQPAACSKPAKLAGDAQEGGSCVPQDGGSEQGGGPVQVTALLAHMLLLLTTGGLRAATALPDTFGTRGFVCAALTARLPAQFLQDLVQRHPEEAAALPACVLRPGAVAFDLFRLWRMDSGDYAAMAGYVLRAWERRWQGTPEAERAPMPRFIHSNLDSYQHIIDVSQLPEGLRPSYYAFGTLADGFLPFPLAPAEPEQGARSRSPAETAAGSHPGTAQGGLPADGRTGSAASLSGLSSGGSAVGRDRGGALLQPGAAAEVGLCSVVAKAVQARHPRLAGCAAESAGKLGDDVSASKAQLDWRLPAEAQGRVRRRLAALAAERPVDAESASAALAAAYDAVVRRRLLGEPG